MAQDEQQVPMFPDPERVWRVLEDIAHTQRLLAEQQHAREQRRNGQGSPAARRKHQPQNKELREWHTFRAKFQRLERIVRRENHMGPDDELTKNMIHAAGGPPPKTMTHHQEYHGLKPDEWPPSTWSEEPPEDKN